MEIRLDDKYVETANRNGSGCCHHRRVHLAADGGLLKFFITVVMVNYFAVPPMQVEDKLGPWKTPMECYLRGRTSSGKLPPRRGFSAPTPFVSSGNRKKKRIFETTRFDVYSVTD